jgi:hypothetical protein
MSLCDHHRDYLSAIADGEYGMVPSETIAHALACGECRREVETQQRLGSLLARRSRPGPVEMPAPRRPAAWRRAAATMSIAVAIALITVTGAFGLQALRGQDPVAAAVSAAGQPPQLRSTDGATIHAWCEQEAERPVPEISTAWLEPTGARMDRYDGDEIITVTYITGQDRTIRVSWIDARRAATSSGSVQARSVSGSTVLVVTSGAGTAVVSGDAPMASLWQAATRIQTLAWVGEPEPGRTGA